ncbi:hypothetical protein [Tautonia rosea]|uniref:hypothetical protein n=1 Tax=Tautonia rosea TaxID=2728037 RepID=UPI0014762869|nr:hypothetical protein [Tautonia rosea]
MRSLRYLAIAAALAAIPAGQAHADLRAKAAREAAEYVVKKFGRAAAREGTETLAGRIASAGAKHGDDAIAAVRRVGPKALTLADEAGEMAPDAYRLLARHGEDAAVWVLGRPGGRRLFAAYGDDAAEALVRHKGLAEPVIERLGGPAVKALSTVSPRGGRRLAMMADGGDLAAIGRGDELMAVIARHGDPAMEFIWRNKGALAVGTTLAAFLAKPEAFLDGTNRLAGTVAETAVRPLAEETARGLSLAIRGLIVLAVLVPAGGFYLAARHPRAAAGIAQAMIELMPARRRR